MLNIIKNDKHKVITSIAILVQKGNKYEEYLDYDITDVYVSDMTKDCGKRLVQLYARLFLVIFLCVYLPGWIFGEEIFIKYNLFFILLHLILAVCFSVFLQPI